MLAQKRNNGHIRNLRNYLTQLKLNSKSYRTSFLLTLYVVATDLLFNSVPFTILTAIAIGLAIACKRVPKQKMQRYYLAVLSLGTALLLPSSSVLAQNAGGGGGGGGGVFGNLPQILSNAAGSTGSGTVTKIFGILGAILACFAIFNFFQGINRVRDGSEFAAAMTPFFLCLGFAAGCPLIILLFTGGGTGV